MSRTRIVAALIAVALVAAGCSDEGESVESAGPKVVALGDSIPLNAPTDCPGCEGFVDSYADSVGADVVNLARGGALTGAIAGEVGEGAFAEELEDADLVIVSFGGNDQPPYRQDYQPCRVDDPDTFVEAVDDLAATTTGCMDRVTERLAEWATEAVGAVHEQAPDAEVVVMPPYNFWLGWPSIESAPDAAREAALKAIAYAVRSWRDELCTIADELDATCIDLYTAFNGPDGSRPAGELLASDHTHPSQQGNDLIRDLLLEANLLPTTPS